MKAPFAIVFLALFAISAFGDDEVTDSPKHSFKIVQHYNGNAGWREELRFNAGNAKPIVLEYGISWPALYYISPDEHWILRIQKSGSGDNISFLYHLDDHHALWRRERQLGEQAFAFLARQPAGLPDGLYHKGIEFTSWDLAQNLLHFSVHGTGDQDGTGIHCSLTYHLDGNFVSSP